MTDFRAVGTIMGLAGLTAVFGMGTGGAPPVSSPESGRGAVRPPRPRWFRCWSRSQISPVRRWWIHPGDAGPMGSGSSGDHSWDSPIDLGRPGSRGGGGSGWSSGSAVRTGRLRRSPAVHSRPIDLVVFQEPS